MHIIDSYSKTCMPQDAFFHEVKPNCEDSLHQISQNEDVDALSLDEGKDTEPSLSDLLVKIRLKSDGLWRQISTYVDSEEIDVNLFNIEDIRLENDELERKILSIKGGFAAFGSKYSSVLFVFTRIFVLRSVCEMLMGVVDLPKFNSLAMRIMEATKNFKKQNYRWSQLEIIRRIHEEIALFGLMSCLPLVGRTMGEAVLTLNIIREAVKGRVLFPADDLSMMDSCASLYVLSEYSGIFYRPSRLALDAWYIPLSPVLESILISSSDEIARTDLVEVFYRLRNVCISQPSDLSTR